MIVFVKCCCCCFQPSVLYNVCSVDICTISHGFRFVYILAEEIPKQDLSADDKPIKFSWLTYVSLFLKKYKGLEHTIFSACCWNKALVYFQFRKGKVLYLPYGHILKLRLLETLPKDLRNDRNRAQGGYILSNDNTNVVDLVCWNK